MKSAVAANDKTISFALGKDASETAMVATLSQSGGLIAFVACSSKGGEKNYRVIEKEALAIIEVVCHWSHYLIGKRFTLTTDQRCINYICDIQHNSKIMNEKMRCWRIEHSYFEYNIINCPGSENVPPYTTPTNNFTELHNALYHPEATRMRYFIRSKNLPFAIK